MRKQTFMVLVNEVGLVYKRPMFHGGHTPLPLEKCLMIAIWYLAKGETYISISDRFNVTGSTTHNCITIILEIMERLLPKFIKWPTEQECIQIEAAYRNIAHYPGVIGSIDGTHFSCKIPVAQHDSYQDRKFQHTISMQGICDPQMVYINISVGYPGSLHDARILRESSINKMIDEHGPDILFYHTYHLIGDSAYPCRSWLMTPYKDNGHLTRNQRRHNYVLSKTRVKIENSFGQLKGRWRILQYINVYSIRRATSMIKACCILHNFCIKQKESYVENYEEQEDELVLAYGEDNDPNGIIKRNIICENL